MKQHPVLAAVNAMLATVVLLGCAHPADSLPVSSGLCGGQWQEGTQFSEMAVKVYPDQHGAYVKLENCSERTFAVDFSESGLYDDEHIELLQKMRINASHGALPIDILISGSLATKEVNGYRRNYLRVTSIVEYSIDD